MGVREAVNSKKSLGIAISSLFLLTAAAILIYTQLPQHRFKVDKAYFTDDDGQTWFLELGVSHSSFRSQRQNRGKSDAVRSYDHGNKTFARLPDEIYG